MATPIDAKPELVKRIGALAAETGSSPEDLARAVEQYRMCLEDLREAIHAGLTSGEPVDGETVFAHLLAELKEEGDR